MLLSGAFAGLSGAFLASELIGNWHEGQTLGLGFISLAALILSNWNPKRLMFFAWLFGFAQAIPLRLNDAPVLRLLPPQFINMIPYVVTIVAIAGFVGKGPPAGGGREGLRGRHDVGSVLLVRHGLVGLTPFRRGGPRSRPARAGCRRSS